MFAEIDWVASCGMPTASRGPRRNTRRIFVAGAAIAALVAVSGCAKGDKGDKGDQALRARLGPPARGPP